MSADESVLSHITLGTNDVKAAARFYDATLKTLGFVREEAPADWPMMYEKPGHLPRVFVVEPFDDRPATSGNGTHIAFNAATREVVDAFYAAALANGGTDEGPPGIREHYSPDYYGAYVRDPDGNKLQAVSFAEQ